MSTATGSGSLYWRVIGAQDDRVNVSRDLDVKETQDARDEEPEDCAECGGTGVSLERGRIVCRSCGGTGAARPSGTEVRHG